MPASDIGVSPERRGFVVEKAFSMPFGLAPYACTADGHGISFQHVDDGRLRLVWDGRGGEPFDGLVESRDKSPAIVTSDDGAHIAYAAGRDGMVFVGRDNLEYPAFEAFTRSVPPVFSHGGTHLAYGAGTSGVFRLVVDGDVVSTMPLAPVQAVFSPPGDHLAFVEMDEPAGRSGQRRIVIDGTAGPWFSGTRNAPGAMQFSPDGRRFAFQGVGVKGQARWVVDDQPQQWTYEVRDLSLARLRGIGVVERPLLACFSPDSRRFAYAADVLGKGVAVLEDDVAGPRFTRVGMPVFSPDSHRLAYIAETSSKTFSVVVDGAPWPDWRASWVSDPVFSPDSRRVAVTFLMEEGGLLRKRRMAGCVVDGRILAVLDGDDVRKPMFSPDGDRVAWLIGSGDVFEVVVDDSAQQGAHVALSAPVFSAAGEVAYAVTVMPEGRVTIMVGGRLGPLADDVHGSHSIMARFEYPRTGQANIPFALSPDGGHVAWAGVFREDMRPVLDEQVGPPFDLLLDWAFHEDGRVVWWAQRADTVYRVTARPARG